MEHTALLIDATALFNIDHTAFERKDTLVRALPTKRMALFTKFTLLLMEWRLL